MAVTSDPTVTTTTPPRILSGREKLRLVAEAETRGETETIASVRKRFRVGRTCLYQARRRAQEALEPRKPGPEPHQRESERLRQENQQLRAETRRLSEQLSQARDRLSRSVEVTPARIVATALIILLSPVSTRRAHTILVAAFGARFAPADNTLSGWVIKYGRLARKILSESTVSVMIRFLAADEIYFHGQPVLCAVEPRSMAIAALERSPDSQGESWEIVFSDFPNLELIASDMGKGLLAAIDRRDVSGQVDLLHFSWLWPDLEKNLSERAEEALDFETLCRDHVYDPKCPGMDQSWG